LKYKGAKYFKKISIFLIKNKKKRVYLCGLQKIKDQNRNKKDKELKCYEFHKIKDLNETKKKMIKVLQKNKIKNS
jgi:hypothetical protein